MKIIQQILDTPWKLCNEIWMYLVKIPIYVYAVLVGIEIGQGSKFYGIPRFYRFRGSTIRIGKRFENRNHWSSNPIGLNHPTIFATWSKNAVIKIGNDVGISGGSVVAATEVQIGDGTLIGANTTIIDTDFHPLDSSPRRYSKDKIRSKAVKIGKNVFIGMNCIVLKGAVIPDNAVIPAGSIVRSNFEYKNYKK
jgi:acetyltransferase-like isoleucine patch superfamily enzyme